RVDRLRSCFPELIQSGALRFGWLDDFRNALNRPARQLRCILTAYACRPLLSVHDTAVSGRSQWRVNLPVASLYPVVDIFVGIDPEVVVNVRPEDVIEEALVGEGPEDGPNPA